MKKTLNINLGGFVFPIDEDAYARLESYINTLKAKFKDVNEQEEIIGDIEYRFAELFSSSMSKTSEVVTIKHVEDAIATMGTPEEIEGDEETQNASTNSSSSSGSNPNHVKRLYRDEDDMVIGGVMSGLAHYTGTDATWWRFAAVILSLASVGIPTVPIYFILWAVIPKATTTSEKLTMKGEPVNLGSIEASVKKNLSAEAISKTTKRLNQNFGEIFTLFAKALIVFATIVLGIKLFGGLILFIFGTFVPLFTIPAELGLVFPSTLYFLFGTISLAMVALIPIALLFYLCLKLLTKRKVNWGRTLGLNATLWIIGLIGIIFVAGSTLNQFKEEASITKYIQMPNESIDELYIERPSLYDDEDFNISFKRGVLQTDGFEYDEATKNLKVDAVELQILTSTDSVFNLALINSSRGKNQSDASEKLEHIISNANFTNDSTLTLPTTLELENIDEWRVQMSKYVLKVPIGKKITFSPNSKSFCVYIEFDEQYADYNLQGNTWEMTKNGLKCLTCTNL